MHSGFPAKDYEDATPNPAKSIRNLRGSAYDLNSAVADLIDNSLDAEATSIEIFIPIDGSSITVLDDGKGMHDDVHRESMKLAAEARIYNSNDLAKFGTGMKAAAMSLGSRLVVATKAEGSERISVRSLDQEHIEKTNDWKTATLVLSEENLPKRTLETLRSQIHGTAVLIERLDKAFGPVIPDTSDEQIPRHLLELEHHLRLIFHRFLDGTHSNRALKLRLNGVDVQPWDPFCLSRDLKLSAKTEVWSAQEIDLGLGRKIQVQGFVLPRQSDFENKTDHQKAAGPKGWNNSQGFYVYRNGRLIRWGGWLRLRSTDEHLKLVRLQLDFSSDLDELFSVNVAKSQINLPKALRTKIDSYVAPILKRGQERYRTGNKVMPPPPPGPTPPPPKRVFRARELARAIDAIFSDRQPEVLELLRTELSTHDRELARDVGWDKS